MKKNLSKVILTLLLLIGVIPAMAAFKDIKVDFTNGQVLTSGESSLITVGIVVNDDGSITRVTSDDVTANAIITGKFHSNEHGLGNFSATVAVDGPVKIGMGTCAWGGDVTVKNAEGTEVAKKFNTNDGTCWHNSKNVIYTYYNGEAATLTITGGSYTPFFSVEAIDASEIPSDINVTYALGESAAEGVLPAKATVAIGGTFDIPVNSSLFVEGKTLTGWTDGTKTYAVGEEVTAGDADMTLTPVFTANTVTLADRTEAVTIKWNFRRDQGCVDVALQGNTGFLVGQATVGSSVIDVKLPIDATSGKFNNTNNKDWSQVNEGTKFAVPSCKGATISMEGYNDITTTTIDGQKDYTQGKTISYEVANVAESVDVVIGDGSYYRYIQVVLPFVEESIIGKTFTNEPATIVWPFNDATIPTVYTATPAELFSTINSDLGDLEIKETGTGQAVDDAGEKVVFIKLRPSGTTQAVKWEAKPTAGLTFTPIKISLYIQRFGTNAENGVTVSAILADGTTVELGNYTAPRNNKDQANDDFGDNSNYTNKVEIELTAEQQTQFTSADGFAITATVGVSATKEGGFSDVQIQGLINGTVADVPKYKLTAVASPAEAATITTYPVAEQYEAGTEVMLTATANFGYNFVNWTDAEGNVVSEENKFKYTVNAEATLTANFDKVNTYELALTMDGGANEYMVSLLPAPTIVDGKNMYEEGTKVSLSASGNAILTFNSWSNGQTSSEIDVTMTEDVKITANYSAKDYIVGWDFYRAGNNGRIADFASTADNEAVQLILTDENGSVAGWLDKSTLAGGGYESFAGAAVNWQQIGKKFYYQTKINASEFTDIKVQAQMLYNYAAYQTQIIEYSLDGTTWKEAGRATMPAVKTAIDITGTLGEDANNAAELYIRFIPDYSSTRDGSGSESDNSNDGTTITNIYITGTMKLVDDGVAPVIVSSVPATGAVGSSANGRVVLNFDEKVKLTSNAKATLNGEELELSVTGKTVAATYKNLAYATEYTFKLAAGSVSDLTDNAMTEDVTIVFTTMTRPTVEKALYDFVVPDDGNFKQALEAAAARADMSKRFRIFVKQGDHLMPTSTEMVTGADGKSYPDPKTTFNTPNTSIIGENADVTSIANNMSNETFTGEFGPAHPLEGIRTSGLLYLGGNAVNTYFQDITLKTNTPDASGRNVILVDGGDKTICKDVCLWAYQDTYVSDRSQSLYYFEGGAIRGRTDFICGSGDVFFNDVDIIMCEAGGYIVAPRDNVKYGYVFKDCTLKGETEAVNGNYYLGRSWTEAGETYYIDCVMEAVPYADGWKNMAAGGWTRCAEFNSTTPSGSVVDLSGRATELGGNPTNPILTSEEAAEIGDMGNMFGDWNPRLYTEQAPAPTNVKLEGNVLSWDDNQYALLWAVCKDGKVVAFTTEPTYTVDDATAAWAVRAANEMGGLGAMSSMNTNSTPVTDIDASAEVVKVAYFTLQGVQVSNDYKGLVVEVKYLSNGEKITTKCLR
jgi:hypothetical protein